MDSNTQPKPFGLENINTTLNRNSTGEQVKALQTYLRDAGYLNVKPDGTYGPITEAAVKEFQTKNGLSPDGVFGPKTLSKGLSMGSTTDTGGNGAPTNAAEEAALKKQLDSAALKHPVFAGNSQDTINYAVETGDFSGILNDVGQPFSTSEQGAAVSQAEKALAPGFNIQKQEDVATTESNLAQQQAEYQDYLDKQATSFQADKTTLDQNAANQGVLFSGGRVQKEKALADSYGKDQATTLRNLGTNVGNTARTFQSAYGDTAAQGLSKYYGAGSNTYNANVATGGAKPVSGLSSLYNPSGLGYQGSANVANTAAAQSRAARLLANKGNKLLLTGNQNKL